MAQVAVAQPEREQKHGAEQRRERGDARARFDLPLVLPLALACEQLLSEGYAEARERAGTFVVEALPGPAPAKRVAATESARPPRLSAAGERLLEVVGPGRASVEPVVGASCPTTSATARRRWRTSRCAPGNGASAGGRGAPRRAPTTTGIARGSPALRAALAGYLRRSRGIACEPDELLIVNGSQQALDLAARVLLDRGDRAVVEEPGFEGARHALRAAGAELVLGAVDDEGFDPAVLDGAGRAARLAYVTPSHQYPLGA